MPKGNNNSVVLSGFHGLNNMAAPEVRGFKFFDEAINVIVDDNGKVRTRRGCELVSANNIHSLWKDGNSLIYRGGAALYLTPLDTMTAVALRNDMIGSARNWYVSVAGDVYYSDGINSGVISRGINRGWGIQPPKAMALSEYPGGLADGRCFVTYSYVRLDGLESGVFKPIAAIDVADGGGFSVAHSASSAEDITGIRIYATKPNTSTLFMVAEVGNSSGTFNYQGDGHEFNRICLTDSLYPAPTGTIVEYYKGRVYVADDSVIYYSRPFAYEHFDMATDYLQMDCRITVMAAVADGIFIATTKNIWFFQGDNPFKATKIADYGAVYGTQAMNHEGNTVYFVSHHGVCSGTTQGQFKNLTIDTFGFPVSSIAGYGAVLHNDGVEQYVCNVYSADIEVANRYRALSDGKGVPTVNPQSWVDMVLVTPIFTVSGSGLVV